MRVLFVVPGFVDSATARYRCAHFAEVLKASGHAADVVSATETTAIRVEHDVVVLHRMGWSGVGQRLVAAARSIGKAVVYSADDLIFEPEYAYQVGLAHPDDPARYHYHRAEGEEARKCLLACDAAIVSTQFLAERTRYALANRESGQTKPVFVVRNFLGAETTKFSQDAMRRRRIGFSKASVDHASGDEERVVLGYLSGSPTHDADLGDIAPALASALAKSPAARLLVVGPAGLPPILKPAFGSGQIQRHPFVPWRDLPGLLAGIDINLAPLDTSRVFNHAKSEVKFLEAAAVGVPTMAGAGIGFAEGVRDGEDCIVVLRPTDWQEALQRLMGDAAERERLGTNACLSVTESGLRSAATGSVTETFLALADLGSPGACRALTVRQPPSERIERAFRRAEDGFLRRCFRLTRHLRLLKGDA